MFEEDGTFTYGGYGRNQAVDLEQSRRVLTDAEKLQTTPQILDHDNPTARAIEGPYYKPSSPLRADLRDSGDAGVFVELQGTVLNRLRQPVPGAVVDLWHANPTGDYDNAGFRYRGHIVTRSDGIYKFKTIKPGAYGDWSAGTGRTVHYHVIIRARNVWPFTTQFYFPNETDNLRDEYFRNDLLLQIQPAGEGLVATFDVVLETFRDSF